MATVRIYKVAELLGLSSQEAMDLLKKETGIDVKSASSSIEEIVARQFVERQAKKRNISLPHGPMFADTPVARKGSGKGGKAPEPPKPAAPALRPRLVKAVKPAGDAPVEGEAAVAAATGVEETAAAAHFVTSYGDDAYLLMHSDRRVDALLLEGLIGDQPDSDLIPKLVRGLLGHKVKGRWENTQESVWVLLALDRYFAESERARFTPATVTAEKALRREIVQIRSTGFAITDEEFTLGIRGVGRAVTIGGEAVGALSCAIPTARFDEAMQRRAMDLLERTSGLLETA